LGLNPSPTRFRAPALTSDDLPPNYQSSTLSQSIKNEITRRKSQERIISVTAIAQPKVSSSSPVKPINAMPRQGGIVPLQGIKKAVTGSATTANRSRDKVTTAKARISVPVSTALSHSNSKKQLLYLDPGLVHRAMHDDIKGALIVPQKSARAN
jgi:hypothetical protein